MSDGAALRVRGVVKRFGEVTALDSVDVTVAPGEVHGLLGANGAGKTTLLRIVLGLVQADSGEVALLDRPADPANPDSRAGVAGFVDDPRFYPYLSGRDNLMLCADYDDSRRRNRVGDVLEIVGLADRAAEPVRGYSTGMRQRLALAAALLRDPRLLILDEPTSGLDPVGVEALHAMLRSMTADGTAVLFSSHDMSEVERMCATLTVLRRGRVAYAGSVDALRAQAPTQAHRLHTSDDSRAAEIAREHVHLRIDHDDDVGLLVHAETGVLDRYVLALAAAGIAVRVLHAEQTPLVRLFLSLNDDEGPAL